MIYFNKQTKGFYIRGLHSYIPSDAIEITEDEYKNLLLGQSQGQLIVSNSIGYPILSAPAPTVYHTWNGSAWVISEEKRLALLESQRQQTRNAINTLRDKKINGGVYVPEIDKWIDSDARAERNLLSTKASFDLFGDDLNIVWTCADNTTIKLDKAIMLNIWQALMANKQQNHANALAHKNAVEQSENPLEYDYSAGWTTTYADFVAGVQNG